MYDLGAKTVFLHDNTTQTPAKSLAELHGINLVIPLSQMPGIFPFQKFGNSLLLPLQVPRTRTFTFTSHNSTHLRCLDIDKVQQAPQP